MLRVLNISEGTSVDGPGLRTAIYFAGCTHHCEGCQNPQSWNPDGGAEMTEDELLRIIAYNDFPVTFSGGDPFFQAEAVAHLAQRIKEEQHRNIWCYTGYRWEQLIQMPRFLPLLQQIDVLVDAPFILAQRNIQLRFRGSENQRIIDVPASLSRGKMVEITAQYMM
ncbi:MAG: anaerobic ribonucleoside-triphosphate reductase activating protein [Bacteroidaceae bacterium]|nr:anaerobic ribonucleoside-triphosphate reductase activating protein [Bacteroidaceae bacterium]MBR1669053.1 anaerobic ribonucleoside-triphosphate reductase activating protein [Bacteroidaceae bacterium]